MLRVRATTVVSRSIRGLHSTARLAAGSVFKMPAMSPTMTEGGVVAWKYKPGEAFSAGDVLLEVETDKATIDVEASDDGVMWEILENDGASGIPVGKPIALLAEQGDDLATLEKPSLEEKHETPKEEPKESKEPKEVKKQEEQKQPKEQSSSASSGTFSAANPNQKLSPAVELLLHANHISGEDAIAKIPASGPKGRLLKGDVLAYLGEINKDSVSKIAEFIKSREHLDLSKIQLATPEETHKLAQREDAPAKPEAPPKPSNILRATLSSVLEETTRESFQAAFENAARNAIRSVYAQKYPQYASSPIAGLSSNDIFDDLISPPVTQDRFEIYDIKYKFSGTSIKAPVDVFDDLLGSVPSGAGAQGLGEVEFKIKFDPKVSDSKTFVALFEKNLAQQVSGVLTVRE